MPSLYTGIVEWDSIKPHNRKEAIIYVSVSYINILKWNYSSWNKFCC